VTPWRWIGASLVYAIRDRQLAEHGGGDGIRDQGAIESALMRPQNLAAHGTPDAANLAASYAFGLARNHGFTDGNKRTAWVVARLFLADNGHRLRFDRAEAVKTMEGLAAGTVNEAELADWFRQRLVSR
jgi:death on curing protein